MLLGDQQRPGEVVRLDPLSQELGVSRPTLREAIYALIHEGLLVQETYKGVAVAEIDADMIHDIAAVRSALEIIAAKSIADDKPGGPRRTALESAYAEYNDAVASGDPGRENAAHLALHETIWIASGNAMLRRIWPIVSASINLALATDSAVRHDLDLARNRQTHHDLVESILANRSRGITKAVREHIQVSAAELLQMLADRDKSL